jgi:hypothetical protein
MTLARSPSQKRQTNDRQGYQDDNEGGGASEVLPLIAKVIYESLALDFFGVHGLLHRSLDFSIPILEVDDFS